MTYVWPQTAGSPVTDRDRQLWRGFRPEWCSVSISVTEIDAGPVKNAVLKSHRSHFEEVMQWRLLSSSKYGHIYRWSHWGCTVALKVALLRMGCTSGDHNECTIWDLIKKCSKNILLIKLFKVARKSSFLTARLMQRFQTFHFIILFWEFWMFSECSETRSNILKN